MLAVWLISEEWSHTLISGYQEGLFIVHYLVINFLIYGGRASDKRAKPFRPSVAILETEEQKRLRTLP
jgi:hypothetical protein